jgi:hypothetical protein
MKTSTLLLGYILALRKATDYALEGGLSREKRIRYATIADYLMRRVFERLEAKDD